MKELTKRQEYLLGLIVREYVQAPSPVSSKLLVEKYGLSFSTATVRNEMALLEDLGFVIAPHTSAGRIPTEAGYRYFVQRLISKSELTDHEQMLIRHQFHQVRSDVQQRLQLAASVLAKTAQTASLVTTPVVKEARLKHLELINTYGRQALLILVLEHGSVRQQMLTLAEPVAQETLSEVATRITSLCAGQNAAMIKANASQLPTLDEEVLELVAEMLRRADTNHELIYTDGLVNILDPNYLLDRLDISDPVEREELTRALALSDVPGARQTLHLLEEQSLLEEVLNEVLAPGNEGVQVMIGGEGRWDELRHTSMILSRYGVQGHVSGALGVLGPIRLQYGRAISTVRYVAGLMSDMMVDLYGDGYSPVLD